MDIAPFELQLCCLGKNPKKNRKENRGVKRKRQEVAMVEGETQGQDKNGKEFLSTSNQEPGSEEVCYTVISHPPLRRLSLSSNEDGYENIDRASRRPGRSRGSQETEYALLRTSTASPMASTLEHDYELVLPC
ncbi:germinal center-associated signaling and motility-like protein [Urocitellus parryii]